MSSGRTEIEVDLRSNLSDFVRAEAPLERVGQWDRSHTYPTAFFDGLARLGYLGIHLPEDVGGAGLGARAMAIVGEELGRGGLEFAVSYGLTAFPALSLCRYGRPEQVRKYVDDAMDHRARFAVGLSEPEAGSDVAAVRTRAEQVSGGHVVTGQKLWTSGAAVPGTVMHALVRTTAGSQRHAGLSVLMIPMDADGVELRRLSTVGRHILGTYEVHLHEVFVPDEGLLGEPGDGWGLMMSNLELERVFAAAELAGCARTTLDLAVAYVRERRQFGRSIGSFQSVSHRLAELDARLEAARLLAFEAADQVDAGIPASRSGSSAKLLCSELFQEISEVGMQFMGGYGYTTEYPMERLWREARSVTVSAGASEIQRTIIARELGIDGSSGATTRR